MQITFDLTNPQHVAMLRQMLGSPVAAEPVAAEPVAAEPVDEPAPKRRGRPPKAKPATTEELVATVGPDVEPEASAPAPEPAAFTIDDVRAALQGFTARQGLPAGIGLLKQFGASRISELKAEDYAAFVKGCAA